MYNATSGSNELVAPLDRLHLIIPGATASPAAQSLVACSVLEDWPASAFDASDAGTIRPA